MKKYIIIHDYFPKYIRSKNSLESLDSLDSDLDEDYEGISNCIEDDLRIVEDPACISPQHRNDLDDWNRRMLQLEKAQFYQDSLLVEEQQQQQQDKDASITEADETTACVQDSTSDTESEADEGNLVGATPAPVIAVETIGSTPPQLVTTNPELSPTPHMNQSPISSPQSSTLEGEQDETTSTTDVSLSPASSQQSQVSANDESFSPKNYKRRRRGARSHLSVPIHLFRSKSTDDMPILSAEAYSKLLDDAILKDEKEEHQNVSHSSNDLLEGEPSKFCKSPKNESKILQSRSEEDIDKLAAEGNSTKTPKKKRFSLQRKQSPISPEVSPLSKQQNHKYNQALKLYRLQRKKRRIEICTASVVREFRAKGHRPLFERDCQLWYQTLQKPGDPRLSDILRRIFICLKFGSTLVRESKKSKKWYLWNHPIAALLSHGSRVMIQLPHARRGQRDDSFWKWLLTGDENGDTRSVMSTYLSSNRAFKENRIIFRRAAATHGISDSQQDKMDFELPYNRCKILHETKNRVGIKHSKFIGSRRYLFENHRHWGMNVPLGGYGNRPYVFERTASEIPLEPYEEKEEINCQGDHGHVYLHYYAPSNGSYGGLLIGTEGSEPNKEAVNGEKHTYKASSPLISPTWGLKWRKKGKPALNIGPDKYNSMLIDLVTPGWKYLKEKEAIWNDRMIFEGCEKPVKAKRVDLNRFYEEQVLAAYLL